MKKITKYKIQITNKLQITNYKSGHGLPKDTPRLQTMIAFNQKLLQGELNQSVSGAVGQLDDRQAQLGNPLIMMPRPHPETNENQHQRFAQHIGSPRRGAPGRRRQEKRP